jgi:phosphate transport system protein
MSDQVDEILQGSRANSSPTSTVPHPSREGLDRELREIKDNILRMGAMVEEQIRASLEALTAHDADAALAVIRGDSRINEMQRKLTTMVSTTIATQAPVARDLRFLIALDHVSYELERMGDHAGSRSASGPHSRSTASSVPSSISTRRPLARWPRATT